MPNPQSNNHQSRDGSGSGDRGRTFRPIEVSNDLLVLVALVGRLAAWSGESPSFVAYSIFQSEEPPEGLL